MDISAEVAARLLGVTAGTARQGLRTMGAPRSEGRGGRNFWGARHLLALMVSSALVRKRVSISAAEDCGRAIGAFRNDEEAEAAIGHGRRFAVIVGANCYPGLLFAQNVAEMQSEKGKALEALGLEIVALDVGPLWSDLMARLAEVKAEAKTEGSARE